MVVGPLFLTIFVNGIPSIVSSPTFMFANNMKIFHVVRNNDNCVALQNDLNLLYEWSIHWQLKFKNVSIYTLDHCIATDHITSMV